MFHLHLLYTVALDAAAAAAAQPDDEWGGREGPSIHPTTLCILKNSMGGLSAVHCHCCQLVTDVLIHCFCYKCYKLSPPADHNNQLVSNKEKSRKEVALTVTTTSKEET